MAEIKITMDNFDEVVMSSKKPVLVDFWASWCGPYKMLGPVIEQIAQTHDDIIVGKVNVDEEEGLAARFGIMSIPTLILFENGEIIKKTLGFKPKEEIEAWINS